ncbi:MAG: hypothetical protein AAFV95_22720 [Bacteroidota bacterium]
MEKRIFELLGTMLFVIGLAAVWGLGSSCGGSNPTPPPPVDANFGTNNSVYNCTISGSPLEIVKQGLNGGGFLVVDVTGDASPAFTFNRVYSQSSSEINCPTGGACCGFIRVPNSGSYTVTMFFNEAGSSACPPPGTNLCYRWFRQESFPSGFEPDCNDNISVNLVNPDGIIGPCS